MKKLLLTGVLATCFSIVNAQTEEGGWLVGASSQLSYSSTNFDGGGDNLSNFNLTGQAGYFVSDNLNFGLLFAIENLKQGDAKQNTSLIGPYLRYYIEGQFFIGAAYGIQNMKLESGGTSFGEANGGNILFEAGYPAWITENIAIEPAVGYSIGKGDFEGSNTFALSIGFGLYF